MSEEQSKERSDERSQALNDFAREKHPGLVGVEVLTCERELVTGRLDPAEAPARLGKLAVFSGVRDFPVRVKCASLAWHTLKAARDRRHEQVTTE